MKHIVIAAAIVFSAIVTSCKSNDPAPSAVTLETAPVSLHLHTYIGQNEVILADAVYRTDDDRKMSLSFAQLYISNIKLVKFDGTLYSVADSIVLATIDNEVYKIGNVPVGNYKSIRFDVGLSNAINAQIPSGTSKLNNPNMWFSSTAQANNNIFMKALGKIDTTVAKNAADVDMIPFTYQIGTQSRLVHVSMPAQNISVQPNTTTYIHMEADYAELFTGFDLTDEDNFSVVTAADNSTSVAINIASRISHMFKYENE